MSSGTPVKSTRMKTLNLAASAWYAPVFIGQWIFGAYIIYTYGFELFGGDINAWNKHLSQAYVPNRDIGNAAVFAHLALGIVIHIGGPLQLVPSFRKRYPALHRWIGRAFVAGVIIGVASGAYMLVVREIGAWTLRAGFIIQAILVLWFTFYTVRHAMRREISTHMRWATRLFLAASAVWFFRVLIMVWFVMTGGIGIDQSNGTGPFIDAMSFLQFLPLVFYEIYLKVKTKGSPTARLGFSVFLWFSAIAIAVGVTLATLGMWFPVL
ncbi:DUF2306 domain-containing protein [Hirschia maritima]|uniref:DUF2306 domain-containing protein n=1 Tax=Hirschia maritima TaxID=1121961 RepID=UPI00036477C9|nr:DUF2306 domain-containing protein [Hirschia maritima]